MQSFSLPPSLRGSANVYSPTCVMVPILCAAISRYICEITPCGRLYASILLFRGKFAQFWCAVPVTADHTLHHAFMSVMISSCPITMSLPGSKKQCQIPGMSRLQKTFLKSRGKCLRTCTAYKTAGSDRVAVLNLERSFFRRDNTLPFSLLHPPLIGIFKHFTMLIFYRICCNL